MKNADRTTLAMLDALQAPGPDPSWADQLSLFGQFVGSWSVELTNYLSDGRRETVPAAWHFGWVLQGRAVQDVFLGPRDHTYQGTYREYGTAVRSYDPSLDVWRVAWSGPLRGRHILLIGRQRADKIVLDGTEESVLLQWVFSDIAEMSFRWRASESDDGGATWTTVQEMEVHRVG